VNVAAAASVETTETGGVTVIVVRITVTTAAETGKTGAEIVTENGVAKAGTRKAGRAEIMTVVVMVRIAPIVAMPRTRAAQFCVLGKKRAREVAVAKVGDLGEVEISTVVMRKVKARAGLSGTLEVAGTWTWKLRSRVAAVGCSGSATTMTARKVGGNDDGVAAQTIGSTICSKRSLNRLIQRRRKSRQSLTRRKTRSPKPRRRRRRRMILRAIEFLP